MARFLYVQTRGRENPERCFTVFFMATVAKALDHDAAIIFTQSGLSIFEPRFADETLALDHSGKTLSDIIAMAAEQSVTFYGCRMSLPMVQLEPAQVSWPMTWIGGADFHELLLDADRTVYLG
jgi:predicted peroxiredoxin